MSSQTTEQESYSPTQLLKIISSQTDSRYGQISWLPKSGDSNKPTSLCLKAITENGPDFLDGIDEGIWNQEWFTRGKVANMKFNLLGTSSSHHAGYFERELGNVDYVAVLTFILDANKMMRSYDKASTKYNVIATAKKAERKKELSSIFEEI